MLPLVILSIEDDSDRAFMSDLFFAYSELMYKVSFGIVRDHYAAEDMVQEACVSLVKHLNSIRKIDRCKIQAYIVSTIRNISINYVVKRNRRNRFSFLTEDDAAFNTVPDCQNVDDAIIRKAETEVLAQALRRLPENEQSILRMKYFDELSDAQIAVILGLKAGSVRMYYTRARRHLKELLAGDDKNG